MKRILTLALASALALPALAHAEKGSPLWLRHQQISPDGSQIAFCYKGDIYTVPTAGGQALRLTSNAAYDGTPIWSPDSRSLAFSSDREGSKDVYIVKADGSGLRRLTYSSEKEVPVAFLDGSTLLFQSYVMPDVKDGMYPWDWFVQTYSLDLSKTIARPKLYGAYPMLMPSLRGGEILYTDVKGYEDIWRKHAVSPVTRDIWLRSKDGKHTKLTTFGGEDRNAVWDSKGGFYYLSEREGSFNVYHRDAATAAAADKKITSFTKDPVRFLSIASNGTLCYGFDGEIYTQTPGGQPTKVNVSIVRDQEESAINPETIRDGVSSFAVAPSNKEIAFIVHGDVFVTHTEYGTTKRLTSTPEEERDVDFSNDGKKIVYAAERNGGWNIYMAELNRSDDPLFVYSRDIKETQLTKNKEASFQPLFSPDGTKVAYLRDRTGIYVHDLKSGRDYKVLDKKFNYSYSDGDISYRWSPDGKWILADYIGHGGWQHPDCAMVKADGSGEIVNLTESGYSEGSGKFVMKGKAVLFSSDRAGYRSHGSWGAERDYYLMFLDRQAYEDFKLSKEDKELRKELADLTTKDKKTDEKKDAKKPAKKSTKKSAKTDAKDAKDTKESKGFTPDFTDLDHRTVRLTRASGSLSDAVITDDGKKLYYIAKYENSYDLWERDLEEQSTKLLSARVGGGSLTLGQDGKTVYVGTSSGLNKLDGGQLKPISFAAEFEHRPAAEREYIFDHAWQQVKEKFYDVNLHGVDWDYYRKTYRKFLPYIDNDEDFGEMLSELLGELNVSHTGSGARSSSSAFPTAELGVFVSPVAGSGALHVDEIVAGGPFDNSHTKLQKGSLITAIDGEKLEAGKDYFPLLNDKAGKRLLVSFRTASGEQVDEVIRPISSSALNDLLYKRWVKQRAEEVERVSKGTLGYVHIPSMGDPSFRTVYSDVMGKYYQKKGIVIDIRYNGGGRLHEDIEAFFTGKHYADQVVRDRQYSEMSSRRWNRPSVLVTCEADYSNAHGTPWVYQHLKVGKVVGMPVAGTMTSVNWVTLLDPSVYFGIPAVGFRLFDGRYLENTQMEPDVVVPLDPTKVLQGVDTQIEKAVEVLHAETK
mgnify:CR=1 FL=1